MAVIVLIQRDVSPDVQHEVFELLRLLRSRAAFRPGYLSSETLFSPNECGRHLVISRWHSLKEWRDWEHSEERQAVLARINPLLKAPAQTQVYLDFPAPVPASA
ncbi:MAG: antibiotic biosynthesis monooxygenase [Chloroflexi bacterium]|nr:antibiotic biosynthesis monooxygenase [Chloroflexota bacterium]